MNRVMVNFKQFWQKTVERLKGRIASPDSRELKRGLAAIRDESHALQAEMDNVRQRVVQASDEGARKLADLQLYVTQANEEGARQLADLQQRVELAESERSQVQQQVQGLRTELRDAATRQDTAETRVRELETELKREHDKQLELMQQVRDRERQLERRTGRTMWIASAALLLGAISSGAMMWSVRSNDKMLAELGKDIRAIKLSMTQQPAPILNTPVVEEFAEPAAVATSPPPVSVPAAAPVQPAATDRQDLLPYSIAGNTGDAGSPNRIYRSREDAKIFFEENARQAGIVTLPGGTQYRILSKGTGRTPAASDRVIVDYRAFLLDGTEFDSAYSDPDPDAATFTVDEVIPGWKEALLNMQEGAQWELYIPPDLAHKGSTRKRSMFGFEPLIYVIELKSVINVDDSSRDE